VAKGWVPRHAFEAAVNFITSSVYRLRAPADDMIFEDAFMKLVVDIGGEALEYIGVG